MAGLLDRLVLRPRERTIWTISSSLQSRGHAQPILKQPRRISIYRRGYHDSPESSQNCVATSIDGTSNRSELTAEDRKRVDELWDSQETVKAIARIMNKRLSVVWKHLLASGSFRQKRDAPKRWTDEEHNMLGELRRQGLSRKSVAEKLGRTLRSVQHYERHAFYESADGHKDTYSLKERDQAIELEKQGLSPTSIAERLKRPVPMVVHMLRLRDNPHRWSTEEMEKLLDFKESNKTWQSVQAMLPGHTLHVLKLKYGDIARSEKPRSSQLAQPGGPWSLEEDAKLLQLRNEQQLTFGRIAQQLPGRSVIALERRYSDIDGSTVGRPKYTLQELQKITRLHAAGWTWQEVAVQLPGRTTLGVQHAFRRICAERYSVDERGKVKWHAVAPQEKVHGADTKA
ncbi:hypothetical protein BST61_g8241 [Cercospora zeina]